MLLKITSKGQVTFPKKVLARLRLKQGDVLQIAETPEGLLVRPRRFDLSKPAPLAHLIQGKFPPLDLEAVRHAALLDPSLRD